MYVLYILYLVYFCDCILAMRMFSPVFSFGDSPVATKRPVMPCINARTKRNHLRKYRMIFFPHVDTSDIYLGGLAFSFPSLVGLGIFCHLSSVTRVGQDNICACHCETTTTKNNGNDNGDVEHGYHVR